MPFSPLSKESVIQKSLTVVSEVPPVMIFLQNCCFPRLAEGLCTKRDVGPGERMCCHLPHCGEWKEYRVSGEAGSGSLCLWQSLPSLAGWV